MIEKGLHQNTVGIGNIAAIMKLDLPSYTGLVGGPLDCTMPYTLQMPIGTTVRLKSGGPKMTISSWSDKEGYCECVWFSKRDTGPYVNYTDELIIKMFHVDTLKIDGE